MTKGHFIAPWTPRPTLRGLDAANASACWITASVSPLDFDQGSSLDACFICMNFTL